MNSYSAYDLLRVRRLPGATTETWTEYVASCFPSHNRLPFPSTHSQCPKPKLMAPIPRTVAITHTSHTPSLAGGGCRWGDAVSADLSHARMMLMYRLETYALGLLCLNKNSAELCIRNTSYANTPCTVTGSVFVCPTML